MIYLAIIGYICMMLITAFGVQVFCLSGDEPSHLDNAKFNSFWWGLFWPVLLVLLTVAACVAVPVVAIMGTLDWLGDRANALVQKRKKKK